MIQPCGKYQLEPDFIRLCCCGCYDIKSARVRRDERIGTLDFPVLEEEGVSLGCFPTPTCLWLRPCRLINSAHQEVLLFHSSGEAALGVQDEAAVFLIRRFL